ncbi:MAG: PHP domain-containing protein [Thermodesulfobacteria bacterium]|nr:PHP domain-containing protein [Thermodesulfobacteriota bacterium]
MRNGIDLHTHSTASDGTFTPGALVQKAHDLGLYALALTDHDTVAGLAEAHEAAKATGMRFVPGVEISVKFDGPGHCHLLGYFFDYRHPRLTETLQALHEARANRNKKMIAKLRELGIEISEEELRALAGDGEIGRPHMAKLLVMKGVVKDFDEAFEKFLGKGKPAYVPKALLSPKEALEIIHEAGGLTSLAHPYYLKLPPEGVRDYVRELKEYGLDAIEAYYTDHDRDYTRFCLELAEEFGLLVSGGSDFHGDNKPEIALGTGKGDLFVPPEVYDRLRAAWEGR